VANELGFSFLPVVNPTPPTEPPVPSRDVLRDIICRILPFLCGSPFGVQALGGRDAVDLIIDAIYDDIAQRQGQP
jgi:hypothetical protein